MEKINLAKRIDQAAGRIPADLVIRNVRYLCVPTGELLTGNIAVGDGVILAAGPESYEGTFHIDGEGLTAVPGFIDTHVHIESTNLTPHEYERVVLPRGTTTAICDPHELANVCGVPALDYFFASSRTMLMDLFVQLSSCVPATDLETSGAVLTAADLAPYRDDPRCGGLAEMMNVPGILMKSPDVLAKLELFQNCHIDGHAPQLGGRELNACLTSGIRTDHECSTPEEALEKIRRGMAILMRDGSASHDLAALAGLLTRETLPFFALCTDDRDLQEILTTGHIDHAIRELIASGTPPELAYSAASFSAARLFRLYDRGILAPGYRADLALLSDYENCRIDRVVKNGHVVTPELFATRPPAPSADFARNSVHRERLHADAFQVASTTAATRVIGVIADSLLTRNLEMDLPLCDGAKIPAPERDVAKLCIIARHGKNRNIGRGFVQGFGLRNAAIASSVAHDSHNLCVIGTDDASMALAANALIDNGGGFAIVHAGKLIASVPLPIGGLLSDQPYELFAAALSELHAAARRTGTPFNSPFLQLSFLALPVIPELKLTDRGLVDVQTFQLLKTQ